MTEEEKMELRAEVANRLELDKEDIETYEWWISLSQKERDEINSDKE